MPAILAGLADFAAAALAALQAVAAFILAVAAVYMWVKLMRPTFIAVSKILPGGWKLFGQVIVPNLRQDWLNLEHAVYVGLVTWRDGAEIEVAYTWHWMGQAWRWNAGMVEWLAKETDASIEWLAHRHVPKWVKWAIYGALPPLLIARLVKALLPLIRTELHRPIQIIYRTLPARTVPIARAVGAVAIPDVWHLPGFAGVWHGLTRRIARIHWRLSRLEKLLTVAGLAAAVAGVLGVAPKCLKRNGNIGRVARGICGLGPRAFEDLLGLLADILILENICTIIGYMEDGLSLIEPELTAFIATAERQFVHCKYELPANNTVAAPSLPPLTGLTLNPA